MSTVTNIILITGVHEAGVSRFQETIFENGRVSGLEQIDGHAGGGKYMEVDVYAGAFNGFGPISQEELIEKFLSIDWEYPEEAILIIKLQDLNATITRPPYHGS